MTHDPRSPDLSSKPFALAWFRENPNALKLFNIARDFLVPLYQSDYHGFINRNAPPEYRFNSHGEGYTTIRASKGHSMVRFGISRTKVAKEYRKDHCRVLKDRNGDPYDVAAFKIDDLNSLIELKKFLNDPMHEIRNFNRPGEKNTNHASKLKSKSTGKAKPSTESLATYVDALPKGKFALALYTDGSNLDINPEGISESGIWTLSEKREFSKILIYQKTMGGGDIYIGDFVGRRDGRDGTFVQFENANLIGRTLSIWTKFTMQPNGRSQRVYLPRPEVIWKDPTEDDDYNEGAVTTVVVNKYERDPKARRKCIEHFGAKCCVCEMTFEDKYGDELGSDFIHVHHVVPLAKIRKKYKVNPLKDLVPVCPNCHAMLHRGDLKPVELKRQLQVR